MEGFPEPQVPHTSGMAKPRGARVTSTSRAFAGSQNPSVKGRGETWLEQVSEGEVTAQPEVSALEMPRRTVLSSGRVGGSWEVLGS